MSAAGSSRAAAGHRRSESRPAMFFSSRAHVVEGWRRAGGVRAGTMKNSGNSSDSDNDSELDSEVQDAEFRLYEQLYFEPNADLIAADDKNTAPQEEKTLGTDRTQYVVAEAVKVVDKNVPPDITLTTASKTQGSDVSQFDQLIFIDTQEGPECALSDFTSDFRLREPQNEPNDHQQTELLTSAVNKDSSCDCTPSVKRNALPSQSVRQRYPSTCSDGSISGSVPLDGLYCNLVTSDKKEEDASIREKLMMKDLIAIDHGNNKEDILAESTKRKRTSSYEETEDSRCNNLINVASKNSSGKSEGCHLIEDSSSDEDIYVLPPPPVVNHEVFTLDSSSDNELKILTKDVKRVRKENNKYQKVEKAGTASLTRQNKERKKSRKREKVCESETDSNDVDFPEANKGTDLTLNIDKSLSGLVNPITKDSKVKASTRISPTKRAKKSSKNLSGKSSVDFTRGRPDTRTKPSCEKWTQSMANFYDSDISDDFDVSEIHQQQSGSPADWHLVSADYYVTQRRRYYNAPERCKLCRQEGHTSKECKRVPKCHLCSRTDHTHRNECPENCCLRCGEEPHFFCPKTERNRPCALCGYPGHIKDLCPDLWRRFHLTTTGMVPQIPLEHHTKPPQEQFCYVCAKRGHYGHQCPLKRSNLAHSQVPQSIVSYSYPVNLVNDNFVVNIEGSQEPILEKNVTKMAIKSDQAGRIIGRRGMVVKEITKETGARVSVVQEGQPQVLIYGESKARHHAQAIIEVLLGMKQSKKYGDFCEHLDAMSRSLEDQSISKKSYNPAAGIKNSTASSGCSNTPTTIAINKSILTVPEVNQSIPVSASTSESRTNTVGVSESENVCPKISWRDNFLFSLNRHKRHVLKTVNQAMAFISNNEKYVNLAKDLNRLKRFRERRRSDPTLQPPETLRKHMKNIAVVTIGQHKFGEGQQIDSEMRTLMKKIQTYPKKSIPEEICVHLAKTLERLHDPPLEKIHLLIEYAEMYKKTFRKKIFKKRKKKSKPSVKEVQQNENTKKVKKKMNKSGGKKKLKQQRNLKVHKRRNRENSTCK